MHPSEAPYYLFKVFDMTNAIEYVARRILNVYSFSEHGIPDYYWPFGFKTFRDEDDGIEGCVFGLVQHEFERPGISVRQAWVDFFDGREDTPLNILNFYKKVVAYIIDLECVNMMPGCHVLTDTMVDVLVEQGSKSVLDYGGGLGYESLSLLSRGFDVSFFELFSLTRHYARLNFEKHGVFDRVSESGFLEEITDDPGYPILDRQYDAVLCKEVFEHCYDVPKVISVISNALKPGGNLVFTASFDSQDGNPSHLSRNINYAVSFRQVLRRGGFGPLLQVGSAPVFLVRKNV